jgi:hypothetical protein
MLGIGSEFLETPGGTEVVFLSAILVRTGRRVRLYRHPAHRVDFTDYRHRFFPAQWDEVGRRRLHEPFWIGLEFVKTGHLPQPWDLRSSRIQDRCPIRCAMECVSSVSARSYRSLLAGDSRNSRLSIDRSWPVSFHHIRSACSMSPSLL